MLKMRVLDVGFDFQKLKSVNTRLKSAARLEQATAPLTP